MGDRRVDIDHQVVLDCELLVSVLNYLHHPTRKVLADHGVGDVGDPLLGQLRQLLHARHEALEIHALPNSVEDVLDGEPLVLRDVHVLQRARLDVLLGAADQVL